jgi:hypothetical protein
MPHGPAGLTRLAKIAATASTKLLPHDIALVESQQPKQGFFTQLREGLFGVLFVMAKDTHVVKRRHVILLFVNLLQVRWTGLVLPAFFQLLA